MDDWQNDLPRVLRLLARILGDVAAAVLAGMMLMTVYDIVARSLGFGSLEPVIELTTMGVVIVASAGLAITTIKAGHVVIDLFTRANRDETNRRIDAFWLVVMAAMLGFMGVLAFREGMTLHGYHMTTEILRWSVLTYYIPPVFGWVLTAVIALWIAWSVFLRRR